MEARVDATADLDDEVQFSNEPCRKCKATPTLIRDCQACGGAGFHDPHDEDPLWFDEGGLAPCEACRGSGSMHWCRGCGCDLNLKRLIGAGASTENVENQ